MEPNSEAVELSIADNTQEPAEEPAERKEPHPRRRWRWGDRLDGRRLRTLSSMTFMIPYLMKIRSDAQNHIEDEICIDAMEEYIAKKKAEGMTGFGLLHVFLAAYVRAISERPGVNRFVAGQHVYARKKITGIMTIKKEMKLDSPDTAIKVDFSPLDTAEEVYRKFSSVAESALEKTTDFDSTARILTKIPGLLLRFTIGFLRFIDYFGLLPGSLERVSPFHGSFVITSMGSLGINAIYHHLYDFGNVPIFFSYGKKYSKYEMQPDHTLVRRRYVTFRVVTDERICDGYYYASAFKIMQRYFAKPELLDIRPDDYREDID